MRAVASTPVNRTARQAKCRPTNGTLFSQLGIVEVRDFDGCLCERAEGDGGSDDRTDGTLLVGKITWPARAYFDLTGAACGSFAIHGLRVPPFLALRMALCFRNSARRRASQGFS